MAIAETGRYNWPAPSAPESVVVCAVFAAVDCAALVDTLTTGEKS
jgi:hypothetical protein